MANFLFKKWKYSLCRLIYINIQKEEKMFGKPHQMLIMVTSGDGIMGDFMFFFLYFVG